MQNLYTRLGVLLFKYLVYTINCIRKANLYWESVCMHILIICMHVIMWSCDYAHWVCFLWRCITKDGYTIQIHLYWWTIIKYILWTGRVNWLYNNIITYIRLACKFYQSMPVEKEIWLIFISHLVYTFMAAGWLSPLQYDNKCSLSHVVPLKNAMRIRAWRVYSVDGLVNAVLWIHCPLTICIPVTTRDLCYLYTLYSLCNNSKNLHEDLTTQDCTIFSQKLVIQIFVKEVNICSSVI